MTAGIPRRAVLAACAAEPIAMSVPVWAELRDVLHRPGLARFIDAVERDELLDLLRGLAVWFVPTEPVRECRDPKDDKFLELALAANARVIVTGDNDLLVLHPWRGIEILRPADYLAWGWSAPG